jgi:hypothetical protein
MLLETLALYQKAQSSFSVESACDFPRIIAQIIHNTSENNSGQSIVIIVPPLLDLLLYHSDTNYSILVLPPNAFPAVQHFSKPDDDI